jgi:(p)ppGpp synthase/HD superfamily hydrolase
MSNQNTQQRPPGYELFFAPLEVTLNPTELESVQYAYFCSKYGHALEIRDDGTRYFDHPKSASWIYVFELGGRDPRMIIDTLLHDLPENSWLLSSYRINMNFGTDIALDVRAMTKLPKGKESTAEYLNRVILQGPWAILGKKCDRLSNLRTLGGCTEEKRKHQLEETREYHLPLLVPALRKYGGKWEKYADIMEQKMLEAMAQYQ